MSHCLEYTDNPFVTQYLAEIIPFFLFLFLKHICENHIITDYCMMNFFIAGVENFRHFVIPENKL